MEFVLLFLAFVLVWPVACAVFTRKIAKSKGFFNTSGWAVAGFFFGPIALVAARFIMPSASDIEPPTISEFRRRAEAL